MKITIERGALLKSLNHVQSVVERRNTIPILSNVLLRAADGQLSLTATDLDIEVVEAIDADVAQAGGTTASAHTLYDIVRKLPDGAQVERHRIADGAHALAELVRHHAFKLGQGALAGGCLAVQSQAARGQQAERQRTYSFICPRHAQPASLLT